MRKIITALLPVLVLVGCAKNMKSYNNDTIAYCSAMGSPAAHREMMSRIQNGEMMPFEARRAYRRYNLDTYRGSAEGVLCIGLNHVSENTSSSGGQSLEVIPQGHNESYKGKVQTTSVECNGKTGTYSSMDNLFFYEGHAYSVKDSNNICSAVK